MHSVIFFPASLPWLHSTENIAWGAGAWLAGITGWGGEWDTEPSAWSTLAACAASCLGEAAGAQHSRHWEQTGVELQGPLG